MGVAGSDRQHRISHYPYASLDQIASSDQPLLTRTCPPRHFRPRFTTIQAQELSNGARRIGIPSHHGGVPIVSLSGSGSRNIPRSRSVPHPHHNCHHLHHYQHQLQQQHHHHYHPHQRQRPPLPPPRGSSFASSRLVNTTTGSTTPPPPLPPYLPGMKMLGAIDENGGMAPDIPIRHPSRLRASGYYHTPGSSRRRRALISSLLVTTASGTGISSATVSPTLPTKRITTPPPKSDYDSVTGPNGEKFSDVRQNKRKGRKQKNYPGLSIWLCMRA